MESYSVGLCPLAAYHLRGSKKGSKLEALLMTPYLWTFRRCPYAIRARMALDVAEVDVEPREVLLRDKPQQMLQDSPKATVPILVLDDGKVLEESLDIMWWALGQADPERWQPQSSEEAAAIERWLDDNDRRFKPLLNRYKYASHHPELAPAEHRDRCRPHLLSMEHSLRERGYLLGRGPTLADVALFPFVRQFHAVDTRALIDWGLERLQSWLQAFVDGARFARVMRRYDLWRPSERVSPD